MSSKSSPLVGEDINLDSNQKNSRRRNLGETNTLSKLANKKQVIKNFKNLSLK